VSENLDQMIRRKQEGQVFIWQRYKEQVQQDFANTIGGTRAGIFSAHCRFQGMIKVLPSLPDLVQRFYFAGLPEWTELTVDCETFHEFAETLAEVLVETIAGETVMEELAEEGEMLVMISDIFGIPIPQDSERLARWCMTHMSVHSNEIQTVLR
jgi:hypothetical protein